MQDITQCGPLRVSWWQSCKTFPGWLLNGFPSELQEGNHARHFILSWKTFFCLLLNGSFRAAGNRLWNTSSFWLLNGFHSEWQSSSHARHFLANYSMDSFQRDEKAVMTDISCWLFKWFPLEWLEISYIGHYGLITQWVPLRVIGGWHRGWSCKI